MKKIIFFPVIIITVFISCSKNREIPHQDSLISLILNDTLQLYVGETENVPVTVYPSNYDRDSLRYTSSDTTIITISNLGMMYAKKTGVSEIRIANITNTKSISTKITVVPAPVDSLKLGLIAYYPFNNNAATDSSGLGNNGTGYNLSSVADRFGNENAAYHFDGSTSYISVADNLYLRLYETDFTQNAWVKLDNYNSSYASAILAKRVTGVANAGYLLSINGDTSAPGFPTTGFTHFGPGGSSSNNAFGMALVALNQWHMVTCVYSYSAKTLTIYVDGVYDDITSNVAAPNASVGAQLYIGRDDPNEDDNGYFIQGDLDDIRIYNRVLAPSEVLKLYKLPY